MELVECSGKRSSMDREFTSSGAKYLRWNIVLFAFSSRLAEESRCNSREHSFPYSREQRRPLLREGRMSYVEACACLFLSTLEYGKSVSELSALHVCLRLL